MAPCRTPSHLPIATLSSRGLARAPGRRDAAISRVCVSGGHTARIVLTAADPAVTWRGMFLSGTPSAASSLKHVRVEHTFGLALATSDDHAVHIDSSVFRQVGNGLHLWGRGSAIRHSRVDTVTGAGSAGVSLGTLTTWEGNVIRGAAHVGLSVLGTYGVTLLGGRIEGSGTLGLWVTTTGPGFLDTEPVRVVGGGGYPAEMVVSAFPRIYPTLADQDSLLGNARDTLVVSGGILQAFAYPTQALPWRVKGDITVQYYGILHAKPGASLGFAPGAGITARNGGRVVARGTAAAPVRFAPYGLGGFDWDGITFEGAPTLGSYLTNVRIEHATNAVVTVSTHPVVVDSSVIRQSGTAAWLAEGSRISRSRVDSTTASGEPAVVLSGNAYLESTLIRGAAKQGVYMNSPTAAILSCEVRGSADAGIELVVVAAVHDCNLVDNGGPGIRNLDTATADAENNWWGDPAGPTGTNGDGVSGSVDYTPWRTSRYVLPYVP